MNRSRTRVRFELEVLEGRVALSHIGAAVEDGAHHNRGGHPAEVHTLKHGADDPAGHEAQDDKGGAVEVVHHQSAVTTAAKHHNHRAAAPAGHK